VARHKDITMTQSLFSLLGRRFARPLQDDPAAAATDGDTQPALAVKPPRPGSKRANVIAMLEREQGATLADITEATSWQAHTARAMLTGLRKQAYAIVGTKAEGGMVYRLGPVA
jgi:hypothetical protein